MPDPLVAKFLDKARLKRSDGVHGLVDALRAVPYGRPDPPTEEGLVEQWTGTCSTKHSLLVRCLHEVAPESNPRLVHRVYRVTAEAALERFGAATAATVPLEGLVDVHTYAVVTLRGRDVVIDVTFPGPAWDGVSDMPVAATEGEDVSAGSDPAATKAELVEAHCDPAVREPFIAALAAAQRAA